MAKASKKEIKVIEVTLALSELETKVLITILERIGGNSEKSYRGVADDIRAALQKQLPAFSAFKETKDDYCHDKVAAGSINFVEGGKFSSDQ